MLNGDKLPVLDCRRPMRRVIPLGVFLVASAWSAAASVTPDRQGVEVAADRSYREVDLRAIRPSPGPHCHIRHADLGIIVTNVTPAAACLFAPGTAQLKDPDRFGLEVTLRLHKGAPADAFGIYVGRRDARRSYLALLLANDGSAALTYIDEHGRWHTIPPAMPQPKPAIRPGAFNQLALEVRHSQVKALLNGELLGSAAPPVPLDGEVGLYVNSPSQEVLVTRFRTFTELPWIFKKPIGPGPGASGS